MAIFNSFLYVHQRVYPINIPLNHYKVPLNHYKSTIIGTIQPLVCSHQPWLEAMAPMAHQGELQRIQEERRKLSLELQAGLGSYGSYGHPMVPYG